jgi:hypothetical protein
MTAAQAIGTLCLALPLAEGFNRLASQERALRRAAGSFILRCHAASILGEWNHSLIPLRTSVA